MKMLFPLVLILLISCDKIEIKRKPKPKDPFEITISTKDAPETPSQKTNKSPKKKAKKEVSQVKLKFTLGMKIAKAAESRIGITKYYDPAYRSLAYPMGDVPNDRGVCTDVVIRSLRAVGIDLQAEVHKDMKRNFSIYPNNWGLKRPDKNIDHRRVPNLMVYFKRKGWSLKPSKYYKDYHTGDIVTWQLSSGRHHIGVVSLKQIKKKYFPLIVHNIGKGTKLENVLSAYKIIGHYRVRR